MGKLAKPQRSKKHKKLKTAGTSGDRKDRLQTGLNQKPKNLSQEIPKKLQRLGAIIDSSKGNESIKYKRMFATPLGEPSSSTPLKGNFKKKKYMKKIKADPTMADPEETKKKKKKSKKRGALKTEDVEEYIDNLKPVNEFVDKVQFKREKNESRVAFLRRVNNETHAVVNRAKIADKFDVPERRKIALMVQRKSKMNEKKKERLAEKKKRKQEISKLRKEKKLSGFENLKDSVAFGDVVHAPPVLKTLPKKALAAEHDKPALRMPELATAIQQNILEATSDSVHFNILKPRSVGQSRKRKHLTMGQKMLEDARREDAVAAYKNLKKAKLKPRI